MRRSLTWFFILLLCAAGVWFLWHGNRDSRAKTPLTAQPAVAGARTSIASFAATNGVKSAMASGVTNKFAWRLRNTDKPISQLIHDPHAILLEDAFIETGKKLNLTIPQSLRSQGDPGAYLVQARGPISPEFRAVLQAAGATIVSYIPNNAYLVRASESVADALAANVLVQAVLPYEPYYKVQPTLLAMADEPLPQDMQLNLALFPSEAAETIQQIEKMGGILVSREESAAGYPIVKVEPPANWTAVAQLPGVHVVEGYYRRGLANDLARPMLGVAADPVTATNYLNLTGQNVMVAVADSGIDITHPDFSLGGSGPLRVFGAPTTDVNGHGTHVAGIIAGDGFESTTVTNAPGSPMPGTNYQFRGKAPKAELYSMNYLDSDEDLQESAAETNALISNNSWDYGNDFDYDLAAASYDAATRDALPFQTGSQPVTFVFSAGDDGNGGIAGTVESPGTAKDLITVGALEEQRYITNQVTNADGTVSQPWLGETEDPSAVPGFSSCGNVGIGTEGTYGRFKPDVVAPGTFVVSCRSQQWDQGAYYNPTNNDYSDFPDYIPTNSVSVAPFQFFVPSNAVEVIFDTVTNAESPVTNADSPAVLPGMPIYVSTNGGPFGFIGSNYVVLAPAPSTLNQNWSVVVSNTTASPLAYDLIVDVQTTNDAGDYYQVLSNLNNSLSGGSGPYYYRYESGTSMAAAAISGFLALIDDYFTNGLKTAPPSPALLKAMTINGARATGNYDFQVDNSINYEGWGLPDLSNSIPAGLTNLPLAGTVGTPGPACSAFFRDQAQGLATGDSQTFNVTLNTNDFGNYLPLRVTLAWTDPPGDPAAALKLVNSLELVVTDLDSPSIVYYGNDIGAGQIFNTPESATNAPIIDTINNVQNIFIQPFTLTNSQPDAHYSVTVIGNRVNVNAVSADTNNDVQDFALVISAGDMGEITDAIQSVTDDGIVSNPTGDQNITAAETNTILLDQIAGANTPLLGSNTIAFTTNTVDVGSNGQFTIGMTNQWHFYIVTNTTTFTNAAFITFGAQTLSIPRIGVFANSEANSTTPGADLDMLVTRSYTDANAWALTNLAPIEVSNCLNGVNGDGASLVAGGTDFVVYSNAQPNEVFYIGIKSESHMGVQFGFIPIFTDIPFSSLDQNGNEYLNGINVPQPIPDGTPSHPGLSFVFSLALFPIVIQNVVVTNVIFSQNFGDLVGSETHGSTSVVLNNHDSYDEAGTFTKIYDDSGQTPGATNSDGPGSLTDFEGASGQGVWQLTEEGTALGQTGEVFSTSIFLQKYQNPFKGITVVIQPHQWFYTYLEVPNGYTNLEVYGQQTNLPASVPPIQMYLNTGGNPTFTDYLFEEDLTNPPPGPYPFPTEGGGPWNIISDGPPLAAGIYYVGLYNPSSDPETVYLQALLNGASTVPQPALFTATNVVPILNDAVTSSTNTTITITNNDAISSANVGIVVQYPRISDLAFTLVSPQGQRILLMENRGGPATTNAGGVFYITNSIGTTTATGSSTATTNTYSIQNPSGSLSVSFNMYTIPDEMTIYYGNDPTTFNTNSGNPDFLYDSGMVSGTSNFTVNFGPGTATSITVIMNQFGNTNSSTGDAWTYTLGGTFPNYNYLTFTDDTNLTLTPIKFAIPPFDLRDLGTNYTFGDLDLASNGDYFGATNIVDAFGGWTVPTNFVTQVITNVVVTNNYNEVSVVANPGVAYNGTNYLALGYGVIQRTNFVTPYRLVTLSYEYRGPGIAGWWRGEGDGRDSSDAEGRGQNGTLIGRFGFPEGEVGQAFEMENNGQQYDFAGTNGYVQIRQQPFLTSVIIPNGTNEPTFKTVQSSYLDVGTGPGLTVDAWINPTNTSFEQPLVEWLARVPTNGSDTNLTIVAGPFLDRATDHYYYMLGATNWTTSETWATEIGGHLATVDTADEQNWIFDTFASWHGRNHNLWLGLTNTMAGGVPTQFTYSSGLTNIAYTNWLTDQPVNVDGTRNYTMMFGETNEYAGLWALADNNGVLYNSTVTNIVYGVVEVTNLQTNGVQFWISVTNVPGTTNLITATNGCLFANLVDATNGSHWIYSAPGLVQSNIFQYVALTYDTNSGIANLYYNGTNVASTNLGVFIPKTTGDVLLGKDMGLETNNYYGGLMDEVSIYSRALSDAEIQAIYSASAYTTNRLIGKFDPSVTPPLSLAEAQVVLGTMTNTILGPDNSWQENSISLIPQTNALPMQISGLEPGMLLDNFSVSEAPLGNLYYLPEQSLDELKNQSASGKWTLEIWDTRNNVLATNVNLLSWQLQLNLVTNTPQPVAVGAQEPTSVTILPGQTVALQVSVPDWATEAKNALLSSTLPLNLFFNSTNVPVGSSPPDIPLASGVTNWTELLTTNSTPGTNIVPGGTYYIGLQNPGTHAASAVFYVDFNITQLTNDVPFNDTLVTNTSLRYFSFDVTSTNAYEATFQLLNMSGNADLVVSKDTPLPTLTSSDYGSFNSGKADENIYVLTNSEPVPLSMGTWYLGVFNRDNHAVNYTVLAQELDSASASGSSNELTSYIPLTNGVPFDWTAGPGAALTNFFTFLVTNTWTITNGVAVTNYVPSVRFELYNLTGNGNLTLQTNAPPFAPPFYQSSQEPGTIPELIQITTNSTLTNLAATYYLGVPNQTTNLIHYTILAIINTNGYFPAFPGAEGAGGGALGASWRNGDTNNTVYHVVNLDDSGPGSLRDAVSAPNRTVVFDISGVIYLQTPLVIASSYLTIEGQTAPEGGITVAGQPVTVSNNAHDIIMRFIRFRPLYAGQDVSEPASGSDALQFDTVSNVIADHISAIWSSNDDLSILNSSNITVQWSILSDSVDVTNQPAPIGALVRYGGGAVSLHHDLFANNYTGSPRLGDDISLDFVDNVIYNWVTNAGYSSADDILTDLNGFTNYLNFRCNYLIAGPNTITTNIAFWGGTNTTWLFQTNNFIDSDRNGVLNGANTKWLMFTNWGSYTNLYTPTNEFPLPPVSVDEAYLAYEKVLDFAGVSMFKREPAESNIVEGVRNQTGTIINLPGVLPVTTSTTIFQDSANDGIPDFWKITFGQAATNAENNIDASGYSELEEFDNWLAVPHALTVTNAPVGVNLQKLFGKTGNLSFFVTNAIHGTVYLTNVLGSYTNTGFFSNSIAIFTPTNSTGAGTNYYGFASFDVYVTNNDTVAYFGPVTVSVFVSAAPPTYSSQYTNGLTAGQPVTNTVSANTVEWYQISVPTNAIAATNQLLFAGTPINLWYSSNQPPTIVYPNDFELLAASTNGSAVISPAGAPLPPVLVPGGTYYLGVENTNNFPTNYAVEVTFNTPSLPPGVIIISPGQPVTNIIPAAASSSFGAVPADSPEGSGSGNTTGSNPVYYGIVVPPNAVSVTNTLLFATGGTASVWFNQNYAPLSGYPGDYELITNYNGTTPISAVLNTNGVPPPPLVPNEIYYLAITNTSTTTTLTDVFEYTFGLAYSPPVLPTVTNVTVAAGNILNVDDQGSDTNAGTLDYFLTTTPPVGATISGNGFITWNVPASEPATNVYFMTVVSNAFTHLTATNDFTATVVPILVPGTPQTNTVQAGYVGWVKVEVPADAQWATNALLFANSLPVNLLFTTNSPPATNSAFTLLANVTSGVSVLGIDTVPTNITANGVYYLGVENTNTTAVNYAVNVTFGLYSPPVLPAVSNLQVVAGTTLVVTNTASDVNPGTLLYSLVTAPAVHAVIGTNGIITWAVPANQPTGNVVFTTVVSNSFTEMTATNNFTVTVVPLSLSATFKSIIYTNIGGTNGFLLSWYAPTNDTFEVQETGSLNRPVTWQTFSSFVTYSGPATATNGLFQFFDNGREYPFGAMRFYRLLLVTGESSLVLPGQSNYVLNVSQPLIVTNTAIDSNPGALVTYSLTASPGPATNPVIGATNGIISWTPGPGDKGGAFTFMTLASDNSSPAATASNAFTVYVLPAPAISNAVVTATNLTLQWTAPMADLFQVEWTTNLKPVVVWTLLPQTISSANGLFSFTDTNRPAAQKFYRLVWLP